MNVLKASLEANVKRVVLTSSGLTIYNYEPVTQALSEKDWVPVEKAKLAYQKSKILAEKAAWDFYEEHKKSGKCFEFTTVIPVWVIGPPLSAASGASVTRFSRLFQVDKVDNMITGVCDVRDVALAHLRAAQVPEAVGQRFLVVSSTSLVSFVDLTNILRDSGYKVAQVEGKKDDEKFDNTKFDDSKMRNVLKIQPTDLKKSVLDMTESLINFGIIKI